MVFAVNPVQTSARNFTAFQALAMTLNGTNATGAAAAPSGSNSSTGASPTNSPNGAVGVRASIGLASAFALVAALL